MRVAFDDQLIMNVTDNEAVPESLHGLKIHACDHFGKQNFSRSSSDLPEKALNCMKKENLALCHNFDKEHIENMTQKTYNTHRRRKEDLPWLQFMKNLK